MFTDRIPAEVLQKQSNVSSDAEMYISAYNIYMGYTTNKEGKVLFPKELVLLSHWNLRDEIKSNYNKGKVGLDKQRTIYEIMLLKLKAGIAYPPLIAFANISLVFTRPKSL